VALVTPFQSNGEIDETALLKIVDSQLQNEVDYLVALGTTAETATLSMEERDRVVRLIVQKVNGKIPLVVGIGGNNTLEVAHLLKNFNLSGVSAVLSVVPYYSKPTQEGLYQHFKCLAGVSPLPIVLYNVPSRTGVNMSAETTLRLARDFENIIATKESSGDLKQIKQIIDNKPADFQVISGDDNFALPLIQLGAVGVISVLSNAFPKEVGQLTQAALNKDIETAESIELQLKGLCELLFTDGNPAGIKAMLHHKGLIENRLRLPLVAATENTCAKIRQTIQELNK